MLLASTYLTLVGRIFMTDSLPFPWFFKYLDVPTSGHLHILRADAHMQWWSWGEIYSNIFQYKKRLDIRKILCSVPTVYCISSFQTFFFYAILFSSPSSLGTDVITGIEKKKNAEAMKNICVFSLDLHFCLLLTGPCLEEGSAWESCCVQVGWELWLHAGSQVPTVWYIRYPRLPMELFPSLHKVWSPGSTQVLSCSHFAPLFLQCIQCDLCLTAAALPMYRGT